FKMNLMYITVIMLISAFKVYCDGVHSPDVPPHRHNRDPKGPIAMRRQNNPEVVPLGSSGTSKDRGGFNFNYFFLWHSDATIINYLSQDRSRDGGQVVTPSAPSSSSSHNGGGGHNGGEEDHFGRLEGLFRVLGRV
ncbi:unnamed protein product, partial [Meganyctiphanes norvegica]